MADFKIVSMKSNYTVPVQIKEVRSNDPRIQVRIVDNVIKPWAMSIAGMVIFDASLTNHDMSGQFSPFLKQISQYSIENPPMIRGGSMTIKS